MKVLRTPAAGHPNPGAPALPPGTAACVGAFDGMHLGHQALLRRARARAEQIAVVTFDPHPARVLAPDRAPPLLQSPRQRERVCAALGVDALVLVPFSRATAAMEPAAFVDEILLRDLGPAVVVVGEDFRFGAGRRGGIDELGRRLAAAGVDLEVVAELCPAPSPATHGTPDKPGKIGSSAIRAAVIEGEVAAIPALLGRPYAVEGVVVHGHGRGRGLGVPTANVACEGALLPRTGVYAAGLTIVDPKSPRAGQIFPAAANLGHNPTFGGEARPILEVHALDVDLGDALYDLTVEVSFLQRLRDEARFADAAALVAAIEGDLRRAREIATPAALRELEVRPL
ncbi:MAG: riboflavin biosynthesis protein RibF [Nannocystaceae bacterium]